MLCFEAHLVNYHHVRMIMEAPVVIKVPVIETPVIVEIVSEPFVEAAPEAAVVISSGKESLPNPITVLIN
jgi:hypothetical protein